MTRAQVLHPVLRDRTGGPEPDAALSEAMSLARALDLELADGAVVPVAKPNPATLIGPGKVEEIAAEIAERGTELVIVNAQLSPVQQRNLERAWKVKVLDRTGLILEISATISSTLPGPIRVAGLGFATGTTAPSANSRSSARARLMASERAASGSDPPGRSRRTG